MPAPSPMPFDPAIQRMPREAAPRRMAPLARLPIFLDLNGKRVVVAGGADAAAWKAELLAAAGARVDVFAIEAEATMAALLVREPDSIRHHPRSWAPADLNGAVLAILDACDDAEASAFSAAAHAAGAIANVIDRPAFCDAQFGSIVNRSPVVIGISTDGAAPVLGQAIRRRIETLLPPALAAWAGLAKSLRGAVRLRLPTTGQRRAFWERFAERAFSRAPDMTDPVKLLHEISATTVARGHVTLVGAGPGDAELLTLKAMRALQSADVILFDDLVSDAVLELARREARRMLVGKRGGRDSCRQDDITALMIRLARQGKRVVRLKSGDPMIFGRAGEEIADLREAGIAVDVVPGITTALALAATLGISLTNRSCAQSLRLVTGHGRHGDLPEELDWRGLADPCTTLVFYMAGRTAPAIARRLLAEGLAGDTPVSIAAGVSRAEEACWHGCLGDVAAGLSADMGSRPVVIGIGRALRRDVARSGLEDTQPDFLAVANARS